MEETIFRLRCRDAHLNVELTELAERTYRERRDTIDRLAPILFEKNRFALYARLDFPCRLALAIAVSAYTKHAYDCRGIDRAVFEDTMGDLAIWCGNGQQEFAQAGLPNFAWIVNHLQLRLFRLGRLQFQPFRFYFPLYVSRKAKKSCPYRRKDDALFVHIPQGEKLDYDACTRSFEYAKEFFQRYFPDKKYKVFITDSWLLGSCNASLAGHESNIVRFADRFTVLGERNDKIETAQRIFGYDLPERLENYPEDTRLRRNAKAYLLAGNRLKCGFGYLPIES